MAKRKRNESKKFSSKPSFKSFTSAYNKPGEQKSKRKGMQNILFG